MAFNRPQIRSGVGAEPVGRGGVAGQAEADADGGCASEGGSAQCAKLVDRGSNVGVLNLLLRGGDQRGLRLQSVERRNLTGDRTQGRDLNVTLLGDFFEAGITILKLLFLGAQFVVTGDLEQHAGVGAGDTGEAEEPDGGADHEYIQVMDRDGDLAQLAVVPASHEKYVEALLQMRSFCVE